MRDKTISKGFSIIEISIAIIIIGILISGISSGVDLLNSYRTIIAKRLTQNCILNKLRTKDNNFLLWYETSLESSFKSSEILENSNISTWHHNDPFSVDKTKSAVAPSDASKQPRILLKAFGGFLPGVSFDGGDYLDFDGTALVGKPYTIFVVDQRRSGKNYNFFLGANGGQTNGNLHLGYDNSTNGIQAHIANDFSYPIEPFSKAIPRIHTFYLDNVLGKVYSINGVALSAPSQKAYLINNNGMGLGKYLSSGSYVGDLAEVIIFNRNLDSATIKEIEKYLGQKYNIAVK